MKQDTHKTVVRFYVEPTGEILATFKTPAKFNGYRPDNKECYSHTGQHSQFHPDYLKRCRKATPEQYKDLHGELESIGYNLTVK